MQAVPAPPLASSATLPGVRLVVLALQHVLVMYAGAVAVPLILGSALKLPRDQVALLINADLFACGVATITQSYGIGPIGIRLPVMMGVTFASVAPMLAMAGNPALGLTAIFGSVIAAGVFGLVVAPFILVAPTLFRAAPEMLRTLLDSGILLATSAAVALNAFFNGAAVGADAPVVVSDHI